jgi:hypothetical protein
MSTPGQMSLFASAPSIFPSDDSPGSVQVTTSLVATGTIAAGSVPTVTMNSSAAAPLFGQTPVPVTFPPGQVQNSDMSTFPNSGIPFNGTTMQGIPVQSVWQHGVTAPLPEMNEEDRRLGCTKCQSIKPAPVSPRAYHYLVGKQVRNRLDLLEAGHCGQCGTSLIYVECECQEPLHDEEMFCRNCGRNNAQSLAKWGILNPPPTQEEEAARGQSSDETFRGEREV